MHFWDFHRSALERETWDGPGWPVTFLFTVLRPTNIFWCHCLISKKKFTGEKPEMVLPALWHSFSLNSLTEDSDLRSLHISCWAAGATSAGQHDEEKLFFVSLDILFDLIHSLFWGWLRFRILDFISVQDMMKRLFFVTLFSFWSDSLTILLHYSHHSICWTSCPGHDEEAVVHADWHSSWLESLTEDSSDRLGNLKCTHRHSKVWQILHSDVSK